MDRERPSVDSKWPAAGDGPVSPRSLEPHPACSPHGGFATTHWSVLLEADGADAAQRMAALEKLCQTYWPPVYAFIRHGGYGMHDAQDLTQSFFAQFLERNAFRDLDPRKGKFRSFILVLLRHFLINEAKRERTAKRGGGRIPVALETDAAEERLEAGSSGDWTAEKLFDRHWALAVLERVFGSLSSEFQGEGESARFEELKVFLSREGRAEDYARAGRAIHLTPGAVKVAVHRLRHRYGELLRLEIAQTVESPFEIEAEMRYLLELLIE